MGAVFTITLFLPIIIPFVFLNSVLEKFGINSFEIFEQIMESAKAWLEANPETALKLGNTLKEIFNAIIEFAEKIN